MAKSTTISGKYTAYGSRSDFYIIDQDRGFKTFTDEYDAQYAIEAQSILSSLNLAPKVYSDIGRIRVGDKLSDIGYITELAETIKCKHATSETSVCGDCNFRESKQLSKRIYKLCLKIGELTKYEFVDDHVGNIGYVVRKGKKILVCIDTGRESVSDGDCEYYQYGY